MNNSSSKVSSLRFPAFKDAPAWEEKKLEDVGKSFNGLTGKTKNDFGMGRPYIQYKQVFNNSKIDMDNFGLVNICEKKQNKVKYGDVLFTTSSETPNEVGYSSVLLNKISDLYLNSFCFGFRANSLNELNPNFSKYLFRSTMVRKKIIKLAQGSTRFNISKIAFMKMKIHLPEPLEQQKIADCLTSLDDLITARSLQVESLKQHKKGLMQQLFPQVDATTPNLRFKGFSGEWEEAELGNYVNIETGKLDANAMIDNGQYRFYTCAKNYCYINNYAFDTDALLISGNGANVGYIHHYNGKFNAYQRTYVLDSFRIKIIYMKYFLENSLYKRIETEKKDGNTPYIVMSTLSEMSILLPTLTEQQKIADCLTSLDGLITAKSLQIESLKQHKKGLMQQLFPNNETSL